LITVLITSIARHTNAVDLSYDLKIAEIHNKICYTAGSSRLRVQKNKTQHSITALGLLCSNPSTQQKRTVYRKRMQNTARAEYQAKGNAQIQTEINSIHTINRPTILWREDDHSHNQ